MITAFNHLIDNKAIRENPLAGMPGTISQAQLISLQISINHNLGTTAPEINMFNENNQAISTEYFNMEVLDLDNVRLTFFADIPSTVALIR